MMKIQIDLPDDLAKKVDIYKATHGLKNKQATIIAMLKEIH
jgi:hypothetical protein